MSASPGSSSSTCSSSTLSKSTTHINRGTIQTPAALFYVQPSVSFRRMTPEEDLVATLLGIEHLVKQRQELVNELVKHHQQLSRKNEIGALTDFSKEIDRIMKIRGLTVMTPSLQRKIQPNLSHHRQQSHEFVKGGIRDKKLANFSSKPDSKLVVEWNKFEPRDMEPKSGLKSLQRMLNLDGKMRRKKRRNE